MLVCAEIHMCIHTHAHVHTYIYVHPQIVMCAAGLWILNVAVETSMFTSVWNCSGRQ